MQSDKIKNIEARTILDSRGNPTVEADVMLYSGATGRAAVPSGASTGMYEAVELRDQKQSFYLGQSVNKAINNIHKKIKPLLINQNIHQIKKIDQLMIKKDNTKNKNKFGANAILAVSLACLRAGANQQQTYLYKYIKDLIE